MNIHFKPETMFIKAENGNYVKVGQVKEIKENEDEEMKKESSKSFFNSKEMSFSCEIENCYMNRRTLHKIGLPNNKLRRLGLPMSRKSLAERKGFKNK